MIITPVQQLKDILCVSRNEVTFLEKGHLGLGEPARPVVDIIERFLSRIWYHYSMTALLVTKELRIAVFKG